MKKLFFTKMVKHFLMKMLFISYTYSSILSVCVVLYFSFFLLQRWPWEVQQCSCGFQARPGPVFTKNKNKNLHINNIALSKSDFTNNIINDVKDFNDFDIENFKLIFDVVMKIVDD